MQVYALQSKPGTIMPTWIQIEGENSDKIDVDLGIDPPQSTYITIRYYNDFP